MRTDIFNTDNRKILFVALLLVCFALSMQSQVTIGAPIPSLKGSIMDLKETDDLTGNANSIKGMMMARVYLNKIDSLTPILTGLEPDYETLKPRYTGLVVYNVNSTPPLEKGLCIWNGNIWSMINSSQGGGSIVAKNGLNLLNNAVELGGSLEENTTINHLGYYINFNPNGGEIGVNVSDPEAIVDIANNNNGDPLILRNVKLTTTEPAVKHYGLRASENGVIRKAEPVITDPNQSFIYNLYTSTVDASGTGFIAVGTTELSMVWRKGTGSSSNNITLPESGTFLFSFRFYGDVTSASAANGTYCINVYKNGNIYYKESIIIRYIKSSWGEATYSITIPVTGAAGDKVSFGILRTAGSTNWTLKTGSDKKANRTSLVFWRL